MLNFLFCLFIYLFLKKYFWYSLMKGLLGTNFDQFKYSLMKGLLGEEVFLGGGVEFSIMGDEKVQV